MSSKNNVGCPNISWYTDDTTASAFVIRTAEELAGLAKIVNGDGIEADDFRNKTITLVDDIDLSDFAAGEGWISIGNPNKKFSGTFDGGGHIISNLTINRGPNGYKDNQGLFGYVDQGCVENVGLVGVNVIGHGKVGSVAGVICGSKVNQVYSTGTVSGYHEDIGGLVGLFVFRSSINCSYSTCAVIGIGDTASKIGGLVGHISDECCILTCAALNTEVLGQSGNKIGRVVGDIDDISKVLHSSVAYERMKTCVNDATVSLPAQNGVSITAAQIKADGTIGGYFTGDNGWTTQNGKLPGLGGRTVDLPEHLRRV